MSDPVLVSIQVSLPRHFGQEGASDPMDGPWTTGFFKEPVVGPIQVGATNLEGDAQADLDHHGGKDKAVLAYSADHYAGWRQSMANPSLANEIAHLASSANGANGLVFPSADGRHRINGYAFYPDRTTVSQMDS